MTTLFQSSPNMLYRMKCSLMKSSNVTFHKWLFRRFQSLRIWNLESRVITIADHGILSSVSDISFPLNKGFVHHQYRNHIRNHSLKLIDCNPQQRTHLQVANRLWGYASCNLKVAYYMYWQVASHMHPFLSQIHVLLFNSHFAHLPRIKEPELQKIAAQRLHRMQWPSRGDLHQNCFVYLCTWPICTNDSRNTAHAPNTTPRK